MHPIEVQGTGGMRGVLQARKSVKAQPEKGDRRAKARAAKDAPSSGSQT